MALLITQGTYSNGRISLRLRDENHVPFGNITVNIPYESLPSSHVFLSNHLTDDNGIMVDVLTALEDKSLIGRTGRTVGPIHGLTFSQFEEAELKELDLEGYDLLD